MDKEKLESLLIDYIDGKLSDDDQKIVLQELADNSDARVLYEQLKIVIDTINQAREWEPHHRLDPGLSGPVGQGDYDFWKSKFGNISGAGAGVGNVPEPATLLLVAIACGAWSTRMRRRCRA